MTTKSLTLVAAVAVVVGFSVTSIQGFTAQPLLGRVEKANLIRMHSSLQTTTTTTTTPSTRQDHYSMEQMASCAVDGMCSVEDMDMMMQELEEFISDETTGHQQQQQLYNALKLRRELQQIGQQITGEESNNDDDDMEDEIYMYSSYRGTSHHAFDNYVDYRLMAQYESH